MHTFNPTQATQNANASSFDPRTNFYLSCKRDNTILLENTLPLNGSRTLYSFSRCKLLLLLTDTKYWGFPVFSCSILNSNREHWQDTTVLTAAHIAGAVAVCKEYPSINQHIDKNIEQPSGIDCKQNTWKYFLPQSSLERWWYYCKRKRNVRYFETFAPLHCGYIPRGGDTPYNGLYGEAPPERGTFFRLQVYERVGVSQAEVYKRVGKSVI